MFYKLIRILAVLVSLLSSFTLFANECVKFRETLKQHAFWEPPQSESYIGYGFVPSYKYYEEKDDWDYDFDEHGLKIQQIYFTLVAFFKIHLVASETTSIIPTEFLDRFDDLMNGTLAPNF